MNPRKGDPTTIIIGDLCNTELDTIWFGQVFAKTSGLIFMKPFAHKNSFTSGENVIHCSSLVPLLHPQNCN